MPASFWPWKLDVYENPTLGRYKLIIRFSSAPAPNLAPARKKIYIEYIKYKYPTRLDIFVILKHLYLYIGEILKDTII